MSNRPKDRQLNRKAIPIQGATEAWFYWNKGSIDIFVRRDMALTTPITLACRLTRKQLAAFVEASK